jgi:hypothetical protein
MIYSEKRKLFEEDSDLSASNPVLNSTLYLKGDNTMPVTLVLTSKTVFYHPLDNRIAKRGFMITFDTIFQIVRPKYKPEEKIFGTPTGIKFICPGYEGQ